jgi:hypothetical protein
MNDYRPLEIKDFAIPPIPPTGDRRKDKIHLAAGRAAHQWEIVEHHLGGIFSIILGTKVPIAALRAYGTVNSFQNRKTMLEAAAASLFHWRPDSEVKNHFDRVMRVCQEASSRRNEIVHGLVIAENRADRDHFLLVPSFHSTKKRGQRSEPKYIYTAKEIEDFRHKFSLLAGEVHRLNLAIREMHLSWPEMSERTHDDNAQE